MVVPPGGSTHPTQTSPLARDGSGGRMTLSQRLACLSRSLARDLVMVAALAIPQGAWCGESPSGWWLQGGQSDFHNGDAVNVGVISWGWEWTHLGELAVTPQGVAGAIGPRSNDSSRATPSVPFFGIGARFTYRDWPVMLSLSVVHNTRQTRNIGGDINFLLGLSYRYRWATFSIGHLSNAFTAKPNRGENFFLVGVMF
jgi:hypothetical protein